MILTGSLTATFDNLADFTKTLADCQASPAITVELNDEESLTLSVTLDIDTTPPPA